MYQQVLDFWFVEIGPEQRFIKDAQFDALLTQRFSALLEQAAQGELFHWRSSLAGRLAEIIVLDQFSRNIYRDTPQAFSQDGMALVLAQEAVALGALEQFSQLDERQFLLMPYMHSESRHIHQQAEALFKRYTNEEVYGYEIKHKVIVDRFQRYPHRNAILGRSSSAEEIAFLQEPNSSF